MKPIKKYNSFTKDKTLPDFYNLYLEKANKRKRGAVDYKLFSKVIKDFNLILRDKIVYKSERVVLPYRLGELYIRKFDVNYDLDNIKNWKVDYKATKEQGQIIYHTNQVGYRWKWSKLGMKLRGKKYYNFKACRKAARMIADAIKNKQLDFYN